jgi:hypothetical protein
LAVACLVAAAASAFCATAAVSLLRPSHRITSPTVFAAAEPASNAFVPARTATTAPPTPAATANAAGGIPPMTFPKVDSTGMP